jgi:hypothetical protein
MCPFVPNWHLPKRATVGSAVAIGRKGDETTFGSAVLVSILFAALDIAELPRQFRKRQLSYTSIERASASEMTEKYEEKEHTRDQRYLSPTLLNRPNSYWPVSPIRKTALPGPVNVPRKAL